MAKVDIDQSTIDRLVGRRVAQFNKTIRGLEQKLERRDKQIQKLKHELEVLKGRMMSEDKKELEEIAKVARALVTMLQEANFVDKYYDSSNEYTAEEYY